jgi:hypothetical protein
MTCNKVAYPTRHVAVHVAIKRALRYRGLHLGVYRCPTCRQWHLTKNRQSQ